MALLILVVVDDLDLVRVAITPREADPPAVIDSDAVPTSPVAAGGHSGQLAGIGTSGSYSSNILCAAY